MKKLDVTFEEVATWFSNIEAVIINKEDIAYPLVVDDDVKGTVIVLTDGSAEDDGEIFRLTQDDVEEVFVEKDNSYTIGSWNFKGLVTESYKIAYEAIFDDLSIMEDLSIVDYPEASCLESLMEKFHEIDKALKSAIS